MYVLCVGNIVEIVSNIVLVISPPKYNISPPPQNEQKPSAGINPLLNQKKSPIDGGAGIAAKETIISLAGALQQAKGRQKSSAARRRRKSQWEIGEIVKAASQSKMQVAILHRKHRKKFMRKSISLRASAVTSRKPWQAETKTLAGWYLGKYYSVRGETICCEK